MEAEAKQKQSVAESHVGEQVAVAAVSKKKSGFDDSFGLGEQKKTFGDTEQKKALQHRDPVTLRNFQGEALQVYTLIASATARDQLALRHLRQQARRPTRWKSSKHGKGHAATIQPVHPAIFQSMFSMSWLFTLPVRCEGCTQVLLPSCGKVLWQRRCLPQAM